MKVCGLIIVAIALTFGNVLTTFSVAQDSAPEFSQKGYLPLPWLLQEVGSKYECFFTIEDSMNENDPLSSLRAQRVAKLSDARNLADELERLRRTVPNFLYEINKDNPKIVHIIDARLLQKKQYALQGIIGKIDFNGQINELPAAISKQGIAIYPMLVVMTSEQPDFITTVEVKGERLSVRDALTNFVPLEGRIGRTIWIARTNVAEDSLTHIYYPWSGKKP